jgi:hypothetical protein
MKLRGENRSEFFPKKPKEGHHAESAGDSDERTGEDIQRPVGSDIHAAERYQSGRKKRNPAPAAVKEKAKTCLVPEQQMMALA